MFVNLEPVDNLKIVLINRRINRSVTSRYVDKKHAILMDTATCLSIVRESETFLQ